MQKYTFLLFFIILEVSLKGMGKSNFLAKFFWVKPNFKKTEKESNKVKYQVSTYFKEFTIQ